MTERGAQVLVRADGNPAIGLGHVTRCLALADRLRARGAAVTFVTRADSAAVLGRIRDAGCAVAALREATPPGRDLPVLLDLIRARGASAVVTDSYEITTEYQRAVRAAGVRLLAVDDLVSGHFAADLVLNPSLCARAERYSAEPYTRLLLGPRYALLRPEFRAPHPADGRRAEPPRVLVIMGGSDPLGLTGRALAELDRLPGDFALDVVAGAAFLPLDDLARTAAAASREVRVHRDPGNLVEIMARSTVAVSAAGSTCWELAYLGVPAVLLVAADNQAGIAAGLDAAGFACSLGPGSPFPAEGLATAVRALLADPARRERMAAVGRSLVDGDGADRAAREVLAP